MPHSTFECQLIGATKADVQATGLFGTGEAFFLAFRLRICVAAAAVLADMAGATLRQSVWAASLALQSMLGLICNLIANRVEAPCLGRNVLAATNALA